MRRPGPSCRGEGRSPLRGSAPAQAPARAPLRIYRRTAWRRSPPLTIIGARSQELDALVALRAPVGELAHISEDLRVADHDFLKLFRGQLQGPALGHGDDAAHGGRA